MEPVGVEPTSDDVSEAASRTSRRKVTSALLQPLPPPCYFVQGSQAVSWVIPSPGQAPGTLLL